jgi:hypothetical protein
MKIMIDLTSLIMLVAVVFLVYVVFDMMKEGRAKKSPVIVRDVEVYDYPGWYSSDWWPWNWSTRPWDGSWGNVWFGPGKPCKGWHCDKPDHKPAHPPINITQNNNVAQPTQAQQEPIQTLPIQDVPVQPPTAEQDIQVALAPTPAAIQPEVSNIGTQTESASAATAPVQETATTIAPTTA